MTDVHSASVRRVVSRLVESGVEASHLDLMVGDQEEGLSQATGCAGHPSEAVARFVGQRALAVLEERMGWGRRGALRGAMPWRLEG
jgi:hypothetical protein